MQQTVKKNNFACSYFIMSGLVCCMSIFVWIEDIICRYNQCCSFLSSGSSCTIETHAASMFNARWRRWGSGRQYLWYLPRFIYPWIGIIPSKSLWEGHLCHVWDVTKVSINTVIIVQNLYKFLKILYCNSRMMMNCKWPFFRGHHIFAVFAIGIQSAKISLPRFRASYRIYRAK